MKIEKIFLKNFLIIRDSIIEPACGLTTVTGETGSGKSLFVSAMKALRGERIGKNLAGKWGGSGEIAFEIKLEESDIEIKQKLSENSIEIEDGEVIIVRRMFGEKNSAYLNGVPVTSSIISDIFADHIEIGSQFENRELFKKDYRMKIIDSKAGNGKLVSEYRKIFEKIMSHRNEISELKSKDDPARRDYLEYQIDEIEKIATYQSEDRDLRIKMDFIENRSKILKYSNELTELFSNCTKDISRSADLSENIAELADMKDLQKRISSVSIEIDDINRSLGTVLSKFDEDIDAENVEERFTQLSTLMMKHQAASSEDLLKRLEQMNEELFEINKIPQKVKKLEKECGELISQATDKALQLRKKREPAAIKLQESILKYLIKFGMSGVKFSVALEKTAELNETGLDSVEFLVNTIGTGEMFQISSLSGGELSRLLLSIKLVDDESGKVLLFDEIDSSIGGETAKNAANEMKKNSNKNQILVVTHFPQTASVADVHILVDKTAVNGEVMAGIRILNRDERVRELARMMGESGSADLLATAGKMLGGDNE
ncbi:MAG TPA: AAA family ATPase [bacterium]|nr:AAA family ATPase [bacterium]HPS30289.1 AAA family ATPase [bacterium]